MQEVKKYLSELGKKGGKRSLKTMTKEQRVERAKKAIKTRWENELRNKENEKGTPR